MSEIKAITEEQARKKGYHPITDYYRADRNFNEEGTKVNEVAMLKDAIKQLGKIDHVVTYKDGKGYKLCRLKTELEKIYKGEKL